MPPDATVGEAARAMRDADVSAAVISDDPPGIVTDSDLRRRVLAGGGGPDTPVRSVMTRPLRTVAWDTALTGLMVVMLDEDVHHVPVTRDGRIVGLVSERDILRRQAKGPLALLARVRALEGLDALDGYAAEIAATADAMLAGGIQPLEIARAIAALNDTLTGRLLQAAEAKLGPPPCPYAWLVLGSEGRMEQFLLSDQDNALVYLEDAPEAAAYFEALAERVVDALIRAGFPPCPGGYMATNWRRALPDWERTFRDWVEEPAPQALIEAEVFLDFRRVHGELSVEALDHILLAGAERGLFLFQLAAAAVKFRPPLRAFGRIRTDGGEIDVKYAGIAAAVLLGRLYALSARSTARSTLERLRAAAAAGTLTESGAESLAEAFRFLMFLRLRAQLRRQAAGQEPDNRVALDALSALERDRLRDALRAIRDLQAATALRFKTETAA